MEKKASRANDSKSKSPKENKKSFGESSDDVKEYVLQKLKDGNALFEAVLIGGEPYFLSVDSQGYVYQIPRTVSMTGGGFHIIPPSKTEYMSKPYEFADNDEYLSYWTRAKEETFDSLFQRVKAILEKYLDTDPDYLTLCASDIILSYFQDKIGLVHYLFFVGDNSTGKSVFLLCFENLGYRVFQAISMTPANIYQYLGGVEVGQGCLAEDEADDIDDNAEKRKIYQGGYTYGAKVPRIDLSFGRRQSSYFTFCMKWFSAEKAPDSQKSKGFNERTFFLNCIAGTPKYYLKDVLGDSEDDTLKALRDEIADVRKLLLLYRIYHFNDKIPNVELNVKNRENELCKPLLRLFQNTGVVSDIERVLTRFINEKRERKNESLDARIYHEIRKLVQSSGYILTSKEIFEHMRNVLEGRLSFEKPQAFYCDDFGEVTKKLIAKIISDKFGAKLKHTNKGNAWQFDADILECQAKNYLESEGVKIMPATLDVYVTKGAKN
jgi:hypothetical protein